MGNTDTFAKSVDDKEHGLIVASPSSTKGGGFYLSTSELDPQELRHSLLFFDRLAWPTNNHIHIESSGDAHYLERADILIRPEVQFTGDYGTSVVGLVPGIVLNELNSAGHGMWSIGTGINSTKLDERAFSKLGGTYFQLLNAIPVPDKDVPLADVLEFKLKRRDELLKLRKTLAGLMANLEASGDNEEALLAQIASVDAGCSDVLRVAAESGFPFRFSDLKVTYNVDVTKLVTGGFAALLATEYVPTTLAAAAALLIGSTTDAFSLSFGGDISWKRKDLSGFPFQYAASIHQELFKS